MRDFAGVLYYHIPTFLKKRGSYRGVGTTGPTVTFCSAGICRYGEAPAAAAPGGHTPAAKDGVPPSLQIPPHTHILLARSPAPYSPFRRCAHSPTAFSGPMARLSPPLSATLPLPRHLLPSDSHGRSPEGVRKTSDRLKRNVFFQKLAQEKRHPGLSV